MVTKTTATMVTINAISGNATKHDGGQLMIETNRNLLMILPTQPVETSPTRKLLHRNAADPPQPGGAIVTCQRCQELFTL